MDDACLLVRLVFFPTYLQLDVVYFLQSERFLQQLELVSYVRKAVKRQSQQSLQCKPEKQRDPNEVAHEDQEMWHLPVCTHWPVAGVFTELGVGNVEVDGHVKIRFVFIVILERSVRCLGIIDFDLDVTGSSHPPLDRNSSRPLTSPRQTASNTLSPSSRLSRMSF